MKRALVAIGVAFAAACGGSSNNSGGTKNLANFQGSTVWNGTINTTLTCTGSAPESRSDPYAVVFSPGSGADLQYTSQAGCTYKFNVSGNTASLSNAPVTCSTTASGTTVTFSWTSFSVTSNDGHSLTLAAAGNGSATGTLASGCPTFTFSMTGSATR